MSTARKALWEARSSSSAPPDPNDAIFEAVTPASSAADVVLNIDAAVAADAARAHSQGEPQRQQQQPRAKQKDVNIFEAVLRLVGHNGGPERDEKDSTSATSASHKSKDARKRGHREKDEKGKSKAEQQKVAMREIVRGITELKLENEDLAKRNAMLEKRVSVLNAELEAERLRVGACEMRCDKLTKRHRRERVITLLAAGVVGIGGVAAALMRHLSSTRTVDP